MGFSCSWAAFEGVSKSDLLARLELVDTGQPGDWLDNHAVCAVTPKGWVVLVGPYDLFDSDRLLALSAHAPVVGGQAEDNECTDHLMACDGGQTRWAVWHDAAVQAIGPDLLEVEGEPPPAFAEVRRAVEANLAANPRADWMFDAPLNLLNALCGWDPQTDAPGIEFTRLGLSASWDRRPPRRGRPFRVSSLDVPAQMRGSLMVNAMGEARGVARLGAYPAIWFAFLAMTPMVSGAPVEMLCGAAMVAALLWLAWRIWFHQDLWAIRWLWLPAMLQAAIFLAVVFAMGGGARDIIAMLGVNGLTALGLMTTGRAARRLREMRRALTDPPAV